MGGVDLGSWPLMKIKQNPPNHAEPSSGRGDGGGSLSQNVDRVLMAGSQWLWEGHVSLLCDPQG